MFLCDSCNYILKASSEQQRKKILAGKYKKYGQSYKDVICVRHLFVMQKNAKVMNGIALIKRMSHKRRNLDFMWAAEFVMNSIVFITFLFFWFVFFLLLIYAFHWLRISLIQCSQTVAESMPKNTLRFISATVILVLHLLFCFSWLFVIYLLAYM